MERNEVFFRNVILIVVVTLIISGFSGITLSASATEQKGKLVEEKTNLSSEIHSFKTAKQTGEVHALGNIDSSEYAARVTVNFNQALNMEAAQRNVYKKAFQKKIIVT